MTTVFKSMNHIVVGVKDLDAAVNDWETYFATRGSAVIEQDDSRRVMFNGGSTGIALAQPIHDRGPLSEFIEGKGQGIYAVALEVDDVAAAADQARQRGAKVCDDDQGSHIYIDPISVSGVRLELWAEGASLQGPRLFSRLHHLVVATTDTETAAGKWHRFFDVEGHGNGKSMIPAAGEGGEYFGLVDAADHPPPVKRFLDDRGEGVYALSVVSDDVEGVIRGVKGRGGRVLGDENGRGQLWVHPLTTHGVLLEVNDSEYSRSWEADYGKPPFNRSV
ncbi:VOC family protein [Dehalococcoidia bacterium]|nr:VOC family protein [Dehalococcoidia bacterium]